MKTKKWNVPAILLACLLVAYAIVAVITCYNTKPAISEGEFPFSITYEYLGETKTISGVYACKYSGSQTILGDHERFWEGEITYSEGEYIVHQEEMKTLAIQPGLEAGYFMGDPLYADYYEDGPAPGVEYYDHENGIELNEENREEVLSSIDFAIVDFLYPTPIENSFSFSGICYEADNVLIFAAITLLYFVLCLIFVRKDKELSYRPLDKVGIAFNFLIGIFAVPFITFTCMLFGIVGSNSAFVEQMIYNVPSITMFCLALSVIFRRQGKKWAGFFIQFGGIAAFFLFMILDGML